MNKIRLLIAALLLAAFLTMTGCKAQQQMQQNITDMDSKVADAQRRITALDGELKKANFEISQMKSLITKLGDVVVNLQKAEEERQRKQAEAEAAKAAAAAKKKPAGKKRR